MQPLCRPPFRVNARAQQETETERPFGIPCAVWSLLVHLQMCNRSLRLDAPMESQQQMELVCAVLELVCAVLGLDAVLGGMALLSMRSKELEHTAELPKVQSTVVEPMKDKMKQTSTKAQIHCSSYAEAVGEDETNRRERAQALELLVESCEGLEAPEAQQ